MDFNNNAVGRSWASENVKFDQIPRLLTTDPSVVLSPEDAKLRGESNVLK